jgi:hypothetical protein
VTTPNITFAVRLCIESRGGDSWTPVTNQRTSIVAAAAWREEMRAWCAANPLPADFEYLIPLPRPVAA